MKTVKFGHAMCYVHPILFSWLAHKISDLSQSRFPRSYWLPYVASSLFLAKIHSVAGYAPRPVDLGQLEAVLGIDTWGLRSIAKLTHSVLGELFFSYGEYNELIFMQTELGGAHRVERTGKGFKLKVLNLGLSENRVYSQLQPFNRDNDQQNHWV